MFLSHLCTEPHVCHTLGWAWEYKDTSYTCQQKRSLSRPWPSHHMQPKEDDLLSNPLRFRRYNDQPWLRNPRNPSQNEQWLFFTDSMARHQSDTEKPGTWSPMSSGKPGEIGSSHYIIFNYYLLTSLTHFLLPHHVLILIGQQPKSDKLTRTFQHRACKLRLLRIPRFCMVKSGKDSKGGRKERAAYSTE